MPYPQDFVEPPEHEHVEPWRDAFPGLSHDKAKWLYEAIAADYRPSDESVSKSQELAVLALRTAARKYKDEALAIFKFLFLFIESSHGSRYLDDAARKAFDWDAFFAVEGSLSLFVREFSIQLYLRSDAELRTSWLRLAPVTKLSAYRNEKNFTPDLVEFVEDIVLPPGCDEAFWNLLLDHPDYLDVLRKLKQGSCYSLDLSVLESDTERRLARRLFLCNAGEGSQELLSLLFNALSLEPAAREIIELLNWDSRERFRLSASLDAAIHDTKQSMVDDSTTIGHLCWDYLLDRLPLAEPSDALALISLFLPIGIGVVIKYPGEGAAEHVQAAAAAFTDVLMNEAIRPLLKSSLKESQPTQHTHDSFSIAIIGEIDSRLANEPDTDLAFLYSLLVRWYDPKSAEHIFLLGRLKSLEPMILKSIKDAGSVAPLLSLGEYCALDVFSDTAWRDAIAMTLAQLGYRATAGTVTADRRNPLFIKALYGQSESGSMPALFSNPFLKFARVLFDGAYMETLFSSTVSDSAETQRLLSVAIALGERAAIDFISSRQRETRGLSFLPAVAFALSLVGADGSGKLTSAAYLEDLGLMAILPLDVLEFLIEDELALMEMMVSKYLSGELGQEAPSVADLRLRYSTLLFEPGLFPYKLKVSAKRVLVNNASAILARIIEKGVGVDASIGLGLADLVLYSADFDLPSEVEFVEACKKAAQLWFDSMRAAARDGTLWSDLPSPSSCLPAAVSILWKLKGPWPVIKQLLTLFRHIPIVSISADLDPLSGDRLGSWQPVARALHNAFDKSWSNEEGRVLRAAMTHDLLEKLKPAKDQAKRTIVEPDENWRYAYVRAVTDLGADPSDTGHFHHQVLDKCAVNDPSPRVRKAAEAAAASLKTRSGWKAGSSKRMLLHAWWWIRQAHLISLGEEINQEAALKRREAETRI
jgi:hypothetical protein